MVTERAFRPLSGWLPLFLTLAVLIAFLSSSRTA